MRRGKIAALVAAASFLALGAASADTPTVGTDSQLPVPRYVSLKTPGANGRHGPGLEHRVDWVYERAGLPLQVTGESGPWRRVVDPDGAVTWMHSQSLDNRRMTYVQSETPLRRSARDSARTIAVLEEGVVGALTACDGEWRRVAVGGRVGWAPAAALWGADCAGL